VLKDSGISRPAELEEKMIEIELAQNMPNAIVEFFPVDSLEQMDMNLQNIMGGIMQGKKKNKKMSVTDARKYLIEQSAEKLIDMDKVVQKAISDVENMGIIFLDEIDKIASSQGLHGPDVSRSGVQRNLLKLMEIEEKHTSYRTASWIGEGDISEKIYLKVRESERIVKLDVKTPSLLRITQKGRVVQDV